MTIDFHYCKFLNHLGVAYLGGLARFIEARNGIVKFDWQTLPPPLFMNLSQNGFLCEFNYDREPWQGNSIPYRCDLHQDTERISSYLEKHWLGQGWVDVSPSLRQAIVSQVWEIYLNAFTHSQSALGVFSCGQHYPKLKQLELTIVDFGIGIPSNVQSTEQNLSSIDAMAWAFKKGNSTIRDEISRGGGLTLLQDFVLKNQGKLTIFSNDVEVVIADNGVKYGMKNVNFSGTLVNIMLRCDEAKYCLDTEIRDLAGQSVF
ncbi:ATP-binding protein [Leptolyngbya boryana CZ1]|uniref:ATP-binding protein n=1 Tax=Leptolyngbya boryana CZ1 TaxID=3060204 RepID=A0AA96WXT9_LEPBY|nr:hypothetical protein [Leptolyngbya boryana]WNZ46114.1 ATP-binding protein [Leptolyngbya boryana CZ1]